MCLEFHTERKFDGELSKRECFAPKDIQYSIERGKNPTNTMSTKPRQRLRREIKIQGGDIPKKVMTEATFLGPRPSLLHANCRYQ